MNWYAITNLPEESAGFVFRLEGGKQDGGNNLKRLYPHTRRHDSGPHSPLMPESQLR